MCTADCTPEGGQCGGTCTTDGHCIPLNDTGDLLGPGGGTAGAGGGLGPGGGGVGCIQQGVEFETLTPTVILLVDRSGSMNAEFGAGGQDRWNAIRDILADPAMGFTFLMQDKVRFGLALYTGFPADPETMMAGSCPDMIKVPPAFNNHPMIQQVFYANEIGNNTPSAEALTNVTADLAAFTEVGPKVIVFATDGDPDSCVDPDANGTDPPRIAVEAAVQAAWDMGITTYAIAVGDEITDLQHMTRVAQIGKGGDPNANYYDAQDSNQLVDAFNTIIGGVISCDFELNGTVAPENQSRGGVAIDGMVIPFGGPDGWEMPSPSTIRLLGASCDLVKLGASRVDIEFPCGTIDIR
jgi:hypothetical protein